MLVLERHQRSVLNARMSPPRVVPALDVGEQRRARFGLRLKAASTEQLTFKAREEALRHRIVVRVTHRAH